jgi:hypothetical protein
MVNKYENVTGEAARRWLLIKDQKPKRRHYYDANGNAFISDGYKLWQIEFSMAENELTNNDVEYLLNIDAFYDT